MKYLPVIMACLLASFLLAGCYESSANLLDASAARQPVAGNADWYRTRHGQKFHDRMSVRADGWYDFSEASVDQNGTEGDWSQHTVLLNDLGNSNGWALYAYATWDNDEKAYIYGIVGVNNGRWQSVQPSCNPSQATDAQQELQPAVQAGAQYDSGKGVCMFADPASLLQALRNFSSSQDFWTQLNDNT